jgi:L-threonylcarbamoyladenylate synthase
MQTKVISAIHSDAIDLAIKMLNRGGIVAFATDTVYGVGALVQNEKSIERLFLAKGREFNKAIAVLIGDLNQLPLLTSDFNARAQTLAKRFWPGGLTLVVEKLAQLPQNLSPLPTIGIRMPDHAFARELLIKAGPLATTSANISGSQNPLSAQDVLNQLDGKIDLLIDGGVSPGGTPSTVVDCTKEEPAIVRIGAISEDEIEKAFS